jgi:UDP-hydrolysing UDP-N-acetyl-D-glucosamine 2-epimerase
MIRRRVAIVTGSRAEYGLLRDLIDSARTDARLELKLVVTGMHLVPEFGLTYTEIESDGLAIDAKVHMLVASDDRAAMVKSVGLGTIGFADAFATLRPEIVVVLGDRFEIFAAVQAALLSKIPVAHIHGGEISEGAVDEQLRHAITKMSHLHFTAAEPYRNRVLRMGEEPHRVFCFGAPGLDVLSRMTFATRADLASLLGMELEKPLHLVTYHPATTSNESQLRSVERLLAALEHLEGTFVVTAPNADPQGRAMAQAMAQWASGRENVALRTNLGHRNYLSVMRASDVVVGNSSSGLIEAPALRVPTVNVGPRQDGRLKGASVIDCEDTTAAIVSAVRRALSADFRATWKDAPLAYPQTGDASKRIADVLATVSLDDIMTKHFQDGAE